MKDLLKQVILEETDTFEILKGKIKKAYKEVLPESKITMSKTFDSKSTIMKCYLLQDTSEWLNGISQNDPISVMMTLTENKDGSFTVEVENNSIFVNAKEQYMAYGSEKLGLRKINAKSEQDLLTKITKAFNKIKTKIIDLYEAGELSSLKQDELIKSKIS